MSTPEKYRFALLSHSTELCDSVRRCLAAEDDCVVDYRLVPLGAEVAVAKELLEDGVEALFCYGGTAQSLLREIGHSLAIIDRTDMQVVQGLLQAKDFSRRVVLSTDYREVRDTKLMERLLDMEILHVQYANWDELLSGIAEACEQGFCTVVGGGLSCRRMERHGGRGVILEPSRHSILEALQQARAIAREKRTEERRHADLLAILSRLDEGVLCVDHAGEVVFCNPTAYRLLKVRPGTPMAALREHLAPFEPRQVLESGEARVDALVAAGKEQFMASTLPLPLRAGKQGAVVMFRDITTLQNMDRKIRSELYSRGFIARHNLRDLKGETPAMRRLAEKIKRYAATDASVHLYGETGTGKELAAHSLHNESGRRAQPFVAVNCSALPESLLESELFGYEEGAFTGAKRGGKAGLFELANQGTLFLDEIGEINHATQLRLLRSLEAKELMRIGGARVVPVDVRIISASHKPLMDLVHNGRFRADLYFRLVVLQLTLPPLRERPEDIPLLLRGLLDRYGKGVRTITPGMLERMRNYAWPGNIRELFSVVESYCILLDGKEADETLFAELFAERAAPRPAAAPSPPSLTASDHRGHLGHPDQDADLKELLERSKVALVREALRAHNNDRQATARRLGISYNTLWRILRGTPDDGE